MARIEDVCEILDSKRIPITASNRIAGPYPYYGANGIQGYVADYIFDDELILLAEDGGNFGSKDKPIAYRVSGKCWVNNHAHVLKPKSGYDVDYVCYSLMYYDVSGLVNGATRQKLTQADMRKMTIPDRSIEEQKNIAAVLNKLTHLISLRKQQLAKLDELVKARFVEMFGNVPGSNFANIEDVCCIVTDGTHQPPKFVEAGIPFLFVSNIVGNIITYDTEKFISEDTYAELIKRTPVEIGDILLSTVGSYGHPAIVQTKDKFCFQRHIAYLKPKHELIDSTYFHAALLSERTQRQIEYKVKGIAQKTLNLSEIRTISIPLSPLNEQRAFSDFAAQVSRQKLTIQQSLNNLELLKKSLMQEYFAR